MESDNVAFLLGFDFLSACKYTYNYKTMADVMFSDAVYCSNIPEFYGDVEFTEVNAITDVHSYTNEQIAQLRAVLPRVRVETMSDDELWINYRHLL